MINTLQNLANGLSDLFKFDNAAQLVINRLLFRSTGPTIYRRNGASIIVDHGADDQNGTRVCLTSDMYSRYYHLLPENKALNILDLGANGGGLPLSLSAEGYTINRLLCVEMNPTTYGRLYYNISQNIDAVHTFILNAAVWNEDGEMEVSLGRGGTNDSVHSTSNTSATGLSVKSVATRTFDSLVEQGFGDEPIDLCKLDVEGAEFETLLSGTAKRFKQVGLLVVEIHPHTKHRAEEIVTWLENQGFAIVGERPSDLSSCWVSAWRNIKH